MNDRFNRKHMQLTDEEKAIIDNIKSEAERLEKLISNIQPSREVSLALTHLEDCVMWTTKAVVMQHKKEFPGM